MAAWPTTETSESARAASEKNPKLGSWGVFMVGGMLRVDCGGTNYVSACRAVGHELEAHSRVAYLVCIDGVVNHCPRYAAHVQREHDRPIAGALNRGVSQHGSPVDGEPEVRLLFFNKHACNGHISLFARLGVTAAMSLVSSSGARVHGASRQTRTAFRHVNMRPRHVL